MFSNEKNSKKLANYSCEKCDFNTSSKNDFNRHNKTIKHLSNGSQCLAIEKTQKTHYECACGKLYQDNSGLWRHKKKCNYNLDTNDTNSNNSNNSNNIINDNTLLTNLVIEVVKNNSDLQKQCVELQKQNQEFQQKIVESFNEVIKNNSNTIISNNNINSHNKSFNLNFFLNETCKDAMNIMDFVDSLKIQLSDLENVGNLGYVNGISKIIVQNLNLLDETKRPVHCTDTKREVMYVKDDNKWEKENENKSKMRKLIKHVTHKNTKLFKEFKAKYPDCENSDSKYSDTYDKLIVEAFGGKGDNDVEKENKIIRNIAKKVTIGK
jgi:hypothetical protein